MTFGNIYIANTNLKNKITKIKNVIFTAIKTNKIR